MTRGKHYNYKDLLSFPCIRTLPCAHRPDPEEYEVEAVLGVRGNFPVSVLYFWLTGWAFVLRHLLVRRPSVRRPSAPMGTFLSGVKTSSDKQYLVKFVLKVKLKNSCLVGNVWWTWTMWSVITLPFKTTCSSTDGYWLHVLCCIVCGPASHFNCHTVLAVVLGWQASVFFSFIELLFLYTTFTISEWQFSGTLERISWMGGNMGAKETLEWSCYFVSIQGLRSHLCFVWDTSRTPTGVSSSN